MARLTVTTCDNCGKQVSEGQAATMRITFTTALRASKQADLCDDCASQMPGSSTTMRTV